MLDCHVRPQAINTVISGVELESLGVTHSTKAGIIFSRVLTLSVTLGIIDVFCL
jgi:hypothetical protein